MPTQINPIAAGILPAPLQETSASSSTADKISQFFTRVEGFGTVFSLLAGAAVALLWGVQFGLIAGLAGIALSLALSLCCRQDAEPVKIEDPTTPPPAERLKYPVFEYSRDHIGRNLPPPKTRAEEYAELLKKLDSPSDAPVPAPREVARPREIARAAPVRARSYSPAENVRIYQETMAYAQMNFAGACADLKAAARIVTELAPSAPGPIYPDMRVYVDNKSTMRMTEDLVRRGLNPLVMDMANASEPGGGVQKGKNAQEEIVCRQSNAMFGLLEAKKKGGYPIPETGGIILPQVTFLRKDPNDGYDFLEQPFRAGLYAVAAFICNTDYKTSPGFRPESDEVYLDLTKVKIENYFRAAIKDGYDSIVASAFGCGAFKNHPVFMAVLFKKILESPEFKGKFKEVAFGIIEDGASGGKNFSTFEGILGAR